MSHPGRGSPSWKRSWTLGRWRHRGRAGAEPSRDREVLADVGGLNRTAGASRRLSSVISMSAVMSSASVATRTGLSENDEAPVRPLRRGAPPYVAIKVATEAPSLNVYAGHSVAVILPGVQPDSSAGWALNRSYGLLGAFSRACAVAAACRTAAMARCPTGVLCSVGAAVDAFDRKTPAFQRLTRGPTRSCARQSPASTAPSMSRWAAASVRAMSWVTRRSWHNPRRPETRSVARARARCGGWPSRT